MSFEDDFDQIVPKPIQDPDQIPEEEWEDEE